MPNPISHAEMIAAVNRAIYRLQRDIEDGEPVVMVGLELIVNDLRAVLAHLERTQPTDTQADLMERARALLRRLRDVDDIVDLPGGAQELEFGLNEGAAIKALAAFAQSEREAAAAEAQAEMLGVLRTVESATASPFYTDKEREAVKHCFDTAQEGIADLRRIASPPAPQEETR